MVIQFILTDSAVDSNVVDCRESCLQRNRAEHSDHTISQWSYLHLSRGPSWCLDYLGGTRRAHNRIYWKFRKFLLSRGGILPHHAQLETVLQHKPIRIPLSRVWQTQLQWHNHKSRSLQATLQWTAILGHHRGVAWKIPFTACANIEKDHQNRWIVRDHIVFNEPKLMMFVAFSCKEYKNLNAFFAIIIGLSNVAISRLTQTWERLNGKLKRIFTQYETLIDSSRYSNSLRQSPIRTLVYFKQKLPPISNYIVEVHATSHTICSPADQRHDNGTRRK